VHFLSQQENPNSNVKALPIRRVALLGDSATQFLAKAIKAHGCTQMLNLEVFDADFDQIQRQIIDPASEMYASQPEFIVLYPCVQKLWTRFVSLRPERKSAFASVVIEEIATWWRTVSQQSKAKLIQFNFVEVNDSVFGHFALKTPESFLFQVKKINGALMDLAREHRHVFLADLAGLTTEVGYATAHDPRFYATAKVAMGIDFIPSAAKAIVDIIKATSGMLKKCLVLDLDNTVWGGVIGDDGMENIEVGELGLGHAYDGLQQWAKELKNRGIILAVCSKNDDEKARQPFLEHPDMTLRLEDIAVFVANWDNKADNLRRIQSILNIGFDSMVFLDDNPFERNLVREKLPEVTVPELPEDPTMYVSYLQSLNLFETASFSEEDLQRTRQYQEESARDDFQKSFTSIDDYLAGLNMTSLARPFEKFSIPRVAQLTQRSNQFNLRTQRYTEAEVERMKDSEDYITLALHLRDKFGDHGLIAVGILKQIDVETAWIDTWLMSCRVLKRGMEEFTVNQMAAQARRRGLRRLAGEYLPTAKNAMVKDLLPRMGFSPKDGRWELDLTTFQEFKTFIREE
jgi:FkbH-like protein